jgi:hypothetical protein
MRKERSILICGVVLSLVARTAPAGAQSSQPNSQPASRPVSRVPVEREASSAIAEAGRWFAEGVRLFREGDYPSALVEFQRAYALVPNYRVLYNIGQTSVVVKDHARALEAFQRYLATGSDRISPDRRLEVEAEIRRLERRVARLRVTTNRKGAKILVDDRSVGATPLAGPVIVNAGRRKVAAVMEGARPVVRFIEVAGGDERSVHLVVVVLPRRPGPDSAAPVAVPTAVGAGEPRQRKRSLRFWIALASTGALLVGTVTTGALALRARGEFEDELGSYPTTTAAVEDARGKMHRLALAADLLLAASAVAGGLSLYFLFADRPAPGSDAARLRISPGPLTVDVKARF